MNSQRRLLLLSVLIAGSWLSACGGGDAPWDEFRPRAAVPSDLENHSFVFTGFRYGAVFDPSWSATTATLAFGAASSLVAPTSLPATLATVDGTSSASATLGADRLTLVMLQVAAHHPFQVGQELTYTLTADADDGRIRLINQATGDEQTSAPR